MMLQDGSYLDYLSFEAIFVFSTFLYYVVILVKNTGVLMLLSVERMNMISMIGPNMKI